MSLAVFVKVNFITCFLMLIINSKQKCFNFVDRGVMFKVVQKYMSPFQGNLDNQVLFAEYTYLPYINGIFHVLIFSIEMLISMYEIPFAVFLYRFYN